MKRLVYILSLIFIANLNCGVKGPPEPPLPNEANLEKQILKDEAKNAAAEPVEKVAPVQEKAKPTGAKKKTKYQ